MELPSIDELAAECVDQPRENKLTAWEREAPTEEVEWFWRAVKALYVDRRMRFTHVHRAVARHLPGFPDITTQTLKPHVDARLSAGD